MTITTEELRARNMAEVNAFIAHGCNPTYGGTPLPRAQEAVATVLHDLEATVERLRGALERIADDGSGSGQRPVRVGPSRAECQRIARQALSTTQEPSTGDRDE